RRGRGPRGPDHPHRGELAPPGIAVPVHTHHPGPPDHEGVIMRSRIAAAAVALGATTALLAGCTGGEGAADGPSSANLYLYQAPVQFNPLAPGQGAEQLTMSLVYNGLFNVGPDFEPVPRLAESWDMSDDATTYTFHLRDG